MSLIQLESNKELLETINFENISNFIQKSCLSNDFKTNFELIDAKLINNTKLTGIFNEKLEKIKQNQLFIEKFAFISVKSDDIIEDFAKNGCKCVLNNLNLFGNSQYGLHVCRYLDVLLESQFDHNDDAIKILVLRVVIGKYHLESLKDCLDNNNANSDCFMSNKIALKEQSIEEKYLNSIMYLYQIDDNAGRFTNILPYAILKYKKHLTTIESFESRLLNFIKTLPDTNEIIDKYDTNIPKWRIIYEKTGQTNIKFKTNTKLVIRLNDICKSKMKWLDDDKTKLNVRNSTNQLLILYEQKKIKPLFKMSTNSNNKINEEKKELVKTQSKSPAKKEEIVILQKKSLLNFEATSLERHLLKKKESLIKPQQKQLKQVLPLKKPTLTQQQVGKIEVKRQFSYWDADSDLDDVRGSSTIQKKPIRMLPKMYTKQFFDQNNNSMNSEILKFNIYKRRKNLIKTSDLINDNNLPRGQFDVDSLKIFTTLNQVISIAGFNNFDLCEVFKPKCIQRISSKKQPIQQQQQAVSLKLTSQLINEPSGNKPTFMTAKISDKEKEKNNEVNQKPTVSLLNEIKNNPEKSTVKPQMSDIKPQGINSLKEPSKGLVEANNVKIPTNIINPPIQALPQNSQTTSIDAAKNNHQNSTTKHQISTNVSQNTYNLILSSKISNEVNNFQIPTRVNASIQSLPQKSQASITINEKNIQNTKPVRSGPNTLTEPLKRPKEFNNIQIPFEVDHNLSSSTQEKPNDPKKNKQSEDLKSSIKVKDQIQTQNTSTIIQNEKNTDARISSKIAFDTINPIEKSIASNEPQNNDKNVQDSQVDIRKVVFKEDVSSTINDTKKSKKRKSTKTKEEKNIKKKKHSKRDLSTSSSSSSSSSDSSDEELQSKHRNVILSKTSSTIEEQVVDYRNDPIYGDCYDFDDISKILETNDLISCQNQSEDSSVILKKPLLPNPEKKTEVKQSNEFYESHINHQSSNIKSRNFDFNKKNIHQNYDHMDKHQIDFNNKLDQISKNIKSNKNNSYFNNQYEHQYHNRNYERKHYYPQNYQQNNYHSGYYDPNHYHQEQNLINNNYYNNYNNHYQQTHEQQTFYQAHPNYKNRSRFNQNDNYNNKQTKEFKHQSHHNYSNSFQQDY